MDDFFKQIKQNLEESAPPPFVEEDWKKLERQLGEQDSGVSPVVSTRWLWTGFMTMLVLFLIAGSLLYGKHQQMYALEQKLEQYIQRDTVYLAERVIQHDTVYITKYVSSATSSMSGSAVVQAFTTSNLPIPQDKDSLDQENGYHVSSQTGKADVVLNDSTADIEQLGFESTMIVEDKSKETTMLLPPSLIEGLTIQPIVAAEQDLVFPEITVEEMPRKRRPIFSFLRPTTYYVNLNGGVGVSVGNKIQAQLGANFGLDLHMSLGKNLGVWGGARYLRSRYELEEPLNEADLPVIAPPSPDYNLVNVDVSRSTLSYAFGLRYSLPVQKKWRAQLDLGITNAHQYPFEAQYEYRNELEDKEWLLPVEVDEYVRVSSILTGRLGASYSIGKRLHTSILLTYLQRQGLSKLQWGDQILLETGLNYFFW